jgi:hypothetical protein
MKRLILILLVFLAGCATVKAVQQPLATPACFCPTPTPPTPTITPTPTATPVVKFDPYDGSYAPANGIYEVGPMTNTVGTACNLTTYTVPRLPNNYFPATCFALYQAPGQVAMDFNYCPANILNVLLTKLNSDWAYNYLNKYSDGVKFNAGFRTTIFPSTPQYKNAVKVTGSRFMKVPGGVAQWWMKIDAMPCDVNTMTAYSKNLGSIPSYWLNAQSDMTYNGALMDGQRLMGYTEALLPITSTKSPMWVQAAQLLNVQVQP